MLFDFNVAMVFQSGIIRKKSRMKQMSATEQTEPARLGSNENLLGPSPKALAAVQDWVQRMHIYPVTEDGTLMEKLVAHIGQGLTIDQVVLGNGSGDVLGVIMQAYVERDDEIVMAKSTFALYRRCLLYTSDAADE